jgi:hypothetical protein
MAEAEPKLVNLMECYVMMVNDQGVSIDDVDFREACDEIMSDLKDGITEETLEIANTLLGKLTTEERETLSIGDQDDWPPLFEKMGPSSAIVGRVLEALFDGIS